MKAKILPAVAAAVAFVAGAASVEAGQTLDAIKQKGFLQCGVHQGLPGFGAPSSTGEWAGFDIDYCRAVAAAVLGDAKKVRFTPLSAQQRFTALQSGEVDLLSRNTTATLGRDTALGLSATTVSFYDGHAFMVPKALNVGSARELNGATVCVQPGTTNEVNTADYFRAQGMTFQPVVIESFDEVVSAFFAGRCDVFASDRSQLASIRTRATNPGDYTILPEIATKEPFAPMVRKGDEAFFDVVRWTVFATFEAEERGITSANVDEKRKSDDPNVQRLLGQSGDLGKGMGLDNDWAYRIVKQVGNYGEIYERNLGTKSPLGLERGLNELWTNGGLIYSWPVR